MPEKKNGLKSKKFWSYVVVVIVVLAAVIISLLFYRQKIETVKLKNLTEDWQTFNSGKYHLSFKYPENWEIKNTENVSDDSSAVRYTIDNKDIKDSQIRLRVSGQRLIDSNEPSDAIQISIPFDKRNYLIFSTSTNNPSKEVFYNIPVTLEIGK